MLKQRVLTALILIPLLVYMVSFAPVILFKIFLFFASLVCFYELNNFKKNRNNTALFLQAGFAFIYFVLVSDKAENMTFAFLLSFFILSSAINLFRGPDLKLKLENIIFETAGFFYIFGTIVCLEKIYLMERGSRLIYLLMFIVFASDTGAYFCGRAFGKHLLNPAVSPKKTVEGLIGGLLSSLIVAYISVFLLGLSAEINYLYLISTVTALAGVFGDLFESLLKRVAGVKDSGILLPGHGGLLDRIDALMFGAPVFLLLLAVI